MQLKANMDAYLDVDNHTHGIPSSKICSHVANGVIDEEIKDGEEWIKGAQSH